MESCSITDEDLLEGIKKLEEEEKTSNPREDEEDEDSNFCSFVFLDVESTGLFSTDSSPKITELSMIAVGTSRFEEMARNPRKSIREVFNKLTLVFFPGKNVGFQAAQVTKLDAMMLEDQARFDPAAVAMINAFLGRLKKPALLVAHNGLKFDLNLLRKEAENVGGKLDFEGCFFWDSLIGFREIFQQRKPCDNNNKDNDNDVVLVSNSDESDDDSKDEALIRDEVEVVDRVPVPSIEGDDSLRNPDEDKKEENELTPVKPIPQLIPNAPKRTTNRRRRWRHHTDEGGSGGEPSPKRKRRISQARKKLDFVTPPSFQLDRLHCHLLGFPPVRSHCAEDDCLSLMRICAIQKTEFFNNSNRKSVLL